MDNSELKKFVELQQGNHQAFDFFFNKYYPALFAYARKMCGESFPAEEIVQQMFIELWEHKNKINIHTSVKAYFFRMVHNDCLDFLKRSPKHTTSDTDSVNTVFEPNFEFYDTLIEAEFGEIMEKAFTALPEQCRNIFFLNRFDGLSYREIALQLDISVKTVENQIGKALKIIREKLQGYFLAFIGILLHFFS